MLWLIIAVLVVIAAALIWNAKRRRGANSLPPPGNIER
jgi:tryptophan-rich sensory protein